MGRLTRRAFLSAAAPVLAAQRPARKGSKIPSEKVEIADPLTERPLFRLTNPAILHHLPHYHHCFIARNNSFLLLASEHSGTRQIYRLNLPKGDMLQLTQGPGIHSYSAAMDARRRDFFYLQQDTLKQASPRGGREKVLYRSPTGWRPTGHLTVSDDGRFAALVEIKPGQQVDGFEEQFRRQPRCRIQVVDVERKANWTAAEQDHWLAHPQFRPRTRDLLYAHEGPWGHVDGRLRFSSLDGKYKRNLRPRQGEEEIGHEFWFRYGAEVCYVFYPDASGRGAEIRCVDPASGQERTLSRCSKFGWVSGNQAGSALVGASRSLAGPNIYVLFPQLRREVTLAEHSSSGKPYPIAGAKREDPYASWPEPVFSADSEWIYFVSDREGKPAVYSMNVSDLVEAT